MNARLGKNAKVPSIKPRAVPIYVWSVVMLPIVISEASIPARNTPINCGEPPR